MIYEGVSSKPIQVCTRELVGFSSGEDGQRNVDSYRARISILFATEYKTTKWTDCIMDKILKNVEIVKFIITALKSILNLVKLQSFVWL